MLLSSTDTTIQNYIDKLNELPIIYIDFSNLPIEFKNFISRQIAKFGILPVEFENLDKQEDGSESVSIKFEIYNEDLNIKFKEDIYILPLDVVLTEPNNIANLLSLLLSNLRKSTSEDLKLWSFIYSNSPDKVYLTVFLGTPYVFLHDKISFEGTELPSFVNALKDDKVIFVWDNYVVYADGSISDLSNTWKMNISNTPLDYVITENRIYILDVTGQLIILNTKSRRPTFTKAFEGAYMLKLESNGLLSVLTTKGHYMIINEKDVIYKEKAEGLESRKSSVRFYPSITDLRITPFGYFYNDIFIGEDMKFSYIKNKILYLITEVGVWKINISD